VIIKDQQVRSVVKQQRQNERRASTAMGVNRDQPAVLGQVLVRTTQVMSPLHRGRNFMALKFFASLNVFRRMKHLFLTLKVKISPHHATESSSR